MAKYRKKPIEVEAIQWTGDNERAIYAWEEEFLRAPNLVVRPEGFIYVHTLEGSMRAQKGDWIIRGVNGEVYPCKPDIFEATYGSVDA